MEKVLKANFVELSTVRFLFVNRSLKEMMNVGLDSSSFFKFPALENSYEIFY